LALQGVIGLASAKLLTQAGWRVIGVDRIRPDDFDGEFIECDLANDKSLKKVCEQLSERQDVLGIVNNFGVVISEHFGQDGHEDFEKLLFLNNWPAIQLTQTLLPSMKAADFGRIINFSIQATKGAIFRMGYAVSNSTLESITKSMAMELADYGITANIVSPGLTETESTRSSIPEGCEITSKKISRVPMKRLGRPDELASAVAYLVSDLASFIIGQMINVDGGVSI
jgi:3-oxoacyl-[acyl-carrier protein] reductase